MSELTMELPNKARDTPAAAAGSKDRLSAMQLLMFGFPALPHAFVALPLFVVLPSFYAAHTAVTLAQIAAIAGIVRIFDALADPLVGFLSDRTRSRLGPRKPWMLGVVLMCPIAIFYLFQPPSDATAVYFGVCSFLLYVGFTMFEIPRQAWGADISRDYLQRSRIAMYIAVFNIAGSLVFWLLPLALSRFTGTTQITGSTLSGIAWLYAICLPLGLLLTVIFVPSGHVVAGAGGALPPKSTLRDLFTSFRNCKPLWRYLVVIGCWGLGQGAFLSTIYIFINDYLKLSAQFPFLMILFFVVQLSALPVWSRLLRHFDRHRLWAFALGADVLVRACVLLLPAGGDHLWPMVALVAVSAFLEAASSFLPGAVLGDVVDYDHMKTGVKKAGNFFALNTVVIKITMAVGSSIAFLLLAATDYKVGGAGNDAHAQLGLVIAYIGFPALMGLIGCALGWNFPITSKRQRTVRRRLERRAAATA